MRELRQSARVSRTPWVTLAITLGTVLLVTAVGGLSSSFDANPGDVGRTLYNFFFSIAFFVVALGGPALAANAIAAEREGRTWEALVLTGLSPRAIVVGKFLSAYTGLALVIVVLAPVGALPILFGGVSPVDVVVAFAYLFVGGAVAVLFGLGVSAIVRSLRAAIVVTLLLAGALAPAFFVLFGFGFGVLAAARWSDIPIGSPLWLPLSYVRAPVSLDYVFFLGVVPLVVLGLPAWFLYALTIANLTGESDDRSTRLKAWFLVASPVLAATALGVVALASENARTPLGISGAILLVLHVTASALVFAGEPFGVSRRIRKAWAERNASALVRFFGPGLGRTYVAVLAIGAACIFTFVAGAAWLAASSAAVTAGDEARRILAFGAHVGAFAVLLIGLAASVRAAGASAWAARAIVLAIACLLSAVPFVVAAIGGFLSNGADEESLVVAAPSPFFAFVVASSVGRGAPTVTSFAAASAATSVVYGALGIVLVGWAALRASRRAAAHEALVLSREAELS